MMLVLSAGIKCINNNSKYLLFDQVQHQLGSNNIKCIKEYHIYNPCG